MKTPVCLTIFLIEMVVIYFFISSRIALKQNIFSNVLGLLSFVLLNALLCILSILGLFLDEWHTEEYVQDRSLNLKGKAIGMGLTVTIISLIALNILVEILKTSSLIFHSNQKRKFFKLRQKSHRLSEAKRNNSAIQNSQNSEVIKFNGQD